MIRANYKNLKSSFFCFLVASATTLSCLPAQANKLDPEDTVVRALMDMRQGRMSSAEATLEPLIEQRPKFKLAQLLYADILNARSGSSLNMQTLGQSDQHSLDGLLAEAKQRIKWNEVRQSLQGKLPASLIKPDRKHPFIVFADLGLSRVFLFKQDQNGNLSLQHDFYASGGKKGTRKKVRGDQRTPLGVYSITSKLTDAELEDRYGPVAFPINYPNAWDKLQQRTGDGIWLHGVTSATYSRPPQDSDGCVALPNEDLEVLEEYLKIGMPVIFAENDNWVDSQSAELTQSTLLASLEAWRQDWESQDNNNYLKHYSTEFKTESHNIKTWSSYKRRVNSSKKYIKVTVEEPVIYGYPGEQDMVQVDFVQHYTSDNYKGKALKQQFWKKQADGTWQITYEGTLQNLS